ncbi:MAG: DUF3293 domain-containing protein [Saprospiraceae bacterium]
MSALKRRKSRIKHVVPIRTLEDSPKQLDRRLLTAYLHTCYRLLAPAVDIRVNCPCPALDEWLTQQRADALAVLTAWNPGSVRLPEADNRARNRLLEQQLAGNCACLEPALGIGDVGDWPPEEIFGAAGISLGNAARLAADFGQNAFVFAPKGELPVLCWLF